MRLVKTYCDGCFLVVWVQDGSSEYVESDHVPRRGVSYSQVFVLFKSASDPLAAPGNKVLSQQGGYHEVLFCDGRGTLTCKHTLHPISPW